MKKFVQFFVEIKKLHFLFLVTVPLKQMKLDVHNACVVIISNHYTLIDARAMYTLSRTANHCIRNFSFYLIAITPGILGKISTLIKYLNWLNI